MGFMKLRSNRNQYYRYHFIICILQQRIIALLLTYTTTIIAIILHNTLNSLIKYKSIKQNIIKQKNKKK